MVSSRAEYYEQWMATHEISPRADQKFEVTIIGILRDTQLENPIVAPYRR